MIQATLAEKQDLDLAKLGKAMETDLTVASLIPDALQTLKTKTKIKKQTHQIFPKEHIFHILIRSLCNH